MLTLADIGASGAVELLLIVVVVLVLAAIGLTLARRL